MIEGSPEHAKTYTPTRYEKFKRKYNSLSEKPAFYNTVAIGGAIIMYSPLFEITMGATDLDYRRNKLTENLGEAVVRYVEIKDSLDDPIYALSLRALSSEDSLVKKLNAESTSQRLLLEEEKLKKQGVDTVWNIYNANLFGSSDFYCMIGRVFAGLGVALYGTSLLKKSRRKNKN